MHYELYVDRVFFLHFIMNLLLLWLTAAAAGLRAPRWRLTSAAAAGALFYLAVLLWPLGRTAEAAVVKTGLQLFGTCLMLQLAFGFARLDAWLRAGLYYAASACVLGGLLTAFRRGKQGDVWGILLPALAAAAAGSLFAKRELSRRRRQRYEVWLCEGDTCIGVEALADSGNSLRDPISGRPVCVAERELLEQLGLTERPERFRPIPYHSIGKRYGVMEAWAVETMYIQREGQRLARKRVLLAVSGQKLSGRDGYRLLLHPALLEEKKGENRDYDTESSDAGKDAV